MKITNLQIYRYSIPLRRPLTIAGSILNRRDGLLLCLSNAAGDSGWGEVAPLPRQGGRGLPGLHHETLAEALQQLISRRSQLIKTDFPDGRPPLALLSGQWLQEEALLPSVRFGLELAALNLLAAAQHMPAAGLLAPNAQLTVSINALLTGRDDHPHEQAAEMAASGFSAVKLKIGRVSVEEDIARVRAVRRALPAAVALRLDANRAWSLDEALAFARGVRGCEFEYIEEPLRAPEDISKFVAGSGIPVALDESLTDTGWEDWLPATGLAALILKPAVLGGISAVWRLAARSSLAGAKKVVSSTFHSGVGLLGEAHLAAALNRGDVPAGLGTYQWLEHDLIDPPFTARNGSVDLMQWPPDHPGIRRELLKEICT